MHRCPNFWLVLSAIALCFLTCHQNQLPNFDQFDSKFFAKYVPEFPEAQLMTINEIPPYQQQFFKEAKGKLQLTYDLNSNGQPEYIICGFSRGMVLRQERPAYFLAIFESTTTGMNLSYLQKLSVPPVTLDISKDTTRPGIIVSFAFFSDYAAEIYFEGNEYHLEKLF
ncbi:MAG: hypothetical protein ONB11_09520 [candidate division KSB1 bacterium]|nr:hypothetical protein [candidate division KSB1 bacterium]MDZ7340907.1 hypothetical protein [candidate division KSB1 bacterium]